MRDLLFKIRENIRPLPIDIYIQPIFDLSTNQIVGGEILARGYTLDSIVPFKNIIEHLQHPDIMLNVGNHVINLFCAFYQQRKMGDLRFNLNVSHLQIQHQKFPAIIEKTLKNYHIEPKTLMLEISCDEPALDEVAIQNLHQLEALGVGIAWDNISSEEQLRALHGLFKVRTLKLKPGKIDEKQTQEINLIIDFADQHDIEVIAEQIETMKQASIFLKRNVTKGQGYIYSRAINTTEFKKRYINTQ